MSIEPKPYLLPELKDIWGVLEREPPRVDTSARGQPPPPWG